MAGPYVRFCGAVDRRGLVGRSTDYRERLPWREFAVLKRYN
jgi:hypothetical protein